MAKPKDLSDNEDVTKQALDAANEFHVKFKTQREQFEEIWNVADYMRKAAQNRTLNQSEMTKGVNPSWDAGTNEQSETGSTTFFRQQKQSASQLVSVAGSSDAPFRYSPVRNPGIFDSESDGREQADSWNTLAKWTMRADEFDMKFIDFAWDLKTFGNVPVMFYQEREKRKVMIRKPKYHMETKPETGEPMAVRDEGYDENEVEVWTKNYPSFKTLPVDSVYADIFIPDLQHQDCVVIPTFVSLSDLIAMNNAELINSEQFEKLDKKDVWDGTTEITAKKRQMENANMSTPTQVTDQFIMWDIFLRCPIEKDKWDDEALVADLYWITVIGNEIKQGLPIRFIRNPDPDDEIPVYMMHDQPGDNNILYHTSVAQILRGNYSVECTLKNQMIDNGSAKNHPPLKEVEGEVRGDDRRFGPKTLFVVEDQNSIDVMDVPDLSDFNLKLLEHVKQDSNEASGISGNVAGDSYGARTSANEAGNAYRNAIQPHMVVTKYSLTQFMRVYARKMHSYWDKYALDGQVVSITDDREQREVFPKDLYGMFDVQIDIVDQYQDDVVTNQKLMDMMNMAGSNPEISRYIDWPQFFGEWLRNVKGIDSAKFIKEISDSDAETVAKDENL